MTSKASWLLTLPSGICKIAIVKKLANCAVIKVNRRAVTKLEIHLDTDDCFRFRTIKYNMASSGTLARL